MKYADIKNILVAVNSSYLPTIFPYSIFVHYIVFEIQHTSKGNWEKEEVEGNTNTKRKSVSERHKIAQDAYVHIHVELYVNSQRSRVMKQVEVIEFRGMVKVFNEYND